MDEENIPEVDPTTEEPTPTTEEPTPTTEEPTPTTEEPTPTTEEPTPTTEEPTPETPPDPIVTAGIPTIDTTGVINGTADNDTLAGTTNNEIINGDTGNDLIWGAGGDDIINGDPGNDTLTGATILVDEAGSKFMASDETGIDTLSGDSGIDVFALGGISQDRTQTFIHYDQAGNDDYAIIEDFTAGEDKIFVAPGTYSLGASPLGEGVGLYINETELIAIIDTIGTIDFTRDFILDS